jgi:hypothetical protein
MSWTLADIRNKVRAVTGHPSTDQISDAALNNYINNYYVLTMPFELKVQIQNEYLQFKTTPGLDVYSFPGGYFTDSPGAYADGFPLVFYQDPDIFFQDWPQQYAVDNIATGDGMTASFSGGLQNPPIIVGSLFIAADDPTGNQQLVSDQGISVTQPIATGSGATNYSGTLDTFPILPGSLSITDGIETFVDNAEGILTGNMGGTGTIAYTTGVWNATFATAVTTGVSIVANYNTNLQSGTLSGNGSGTINYLTGAYTVEFNNPPASTAIIYAKYQGYSGNRPQGVLFFSNQFTFRPVPDQAYAILMQGFIQPVALVNNGDIPTQPEWGPLIAYGASLDLFESIGDTENYDRYYPVFKRFENVALGRAIQQYTQEQGVPRF